MRPNALDHVALWVDDRRELAAFLTEHLGMHEITSGDDFTLVGADARRGKLTLFDAPGPRERGVLERVVLRVHDLAAAVAALPTVALLNGDDRPGVRLAAPGGLELGLVQGGADTVDYDLDHIVLRVPDPERTAAVLSGLGFDRNDDRLSIADKHLRLTQGSVELYGAPLLNHVALLVDSGAAVRSEAERRGLSIEKVVDAANTLAVFVRGPDAITLEYVEHKPGFALA
jgi:catechol 2,3-dioxygenase-like lactoylglutathione lyase family enzyme